VTVGRGAPARPRVIDSTPVRPLDRPRPGGTAIAPAKKTKPLKRTASPRARAKPRRPAAPKRRAARGATPDHHPLGMGMADGFAMDRLSAPARLKRAPKRAMREIGWAAFGEVARALAATVAEKFRPDVVVGIAKGGVFAGGAIAAALGVEFLQVRIDKRRRDTEAFPLATAELPPLPGKRVLVVDDVAATGATLAKARALARKAGAREVRTAVIVSRPGGARPDWFALETDELILFGWDYQLDAAGAGPGDPGEVGV
jgi:hypoxanthine phosphoribosyltransferase